jgi:hypothetical protein
MGAAKLRWAVGMRAGGQVSDSTVSLRAWCPRVSGRSRQGRHPRRDSGSAAKLRSIAFAAMEPRRPEAVFERAADEAEEQDERPFDVEVTFGVFHVLRFLGGGHEPAEAGQLFDRIPIELQYSSMRTPALSGYSRPARSGSLSPPSATSMRSGRAGLCRRTRIPPTRTCCMPSASAARPLRRPRSQEDQHRTGPDECRGEVGVKHAMVRASRSILHQNARDSITMLARSIAGSR